MRDFADELGLFLELYNSTWRPNWGFVPLTEAELRFQAKLLRRIIDPRVVLLAERDGDLVGGILCLPNINELMAKVGGRLLPFGWLKFSFGKRKLSSLRVFAMGIKPEYQHTGVAAALAVRMRESLRVSRIDFGELGWILETNEATNTIAKRMNGQIVKRYRIYKKPVQGGAQRRAAADVTRA
jgi:GNAT superfamily N-acetyltransferase